MISKEQIADLERHSVALVWATPGGEDLLVKIAKVSNPARQNEPSPRLIRYLMENNHWSPFEMVNICFEVNTTRDIGRQFLRHWTMRPQEFSQRYQDVTTLGDPIYRRARMQHPTNRQMSLPCEDQEIVQWWAGVQSQVWGIVESRYKQALAKGVSKEVARAIMPEGLTPSRLYFNAPLRSALHACYVRGKGHGAQSEATWIAEGIEALIREEYPATFEAFQDWKKHNDRPEEYKPQGRGWRSSLASAFLRAACRLDGGGGRPS